MAPCRTRFRSEMLSAPAIIPATMDPIFRPGLAPLSVGTLRCSSASSSSPDCSAKAMIGTRPAYDTRLGSSNRAAATGRVWDSCICESPSSWPNSILKKSHSSTTAGHFASKTHPRLLLNRCIQAKRAREKQSMANTIKGK